MFYRRMNVLVLLLFVFSTAFAKNLFLDSLVNYVERGAPGVKFGLSVRSVNTDSVFYDYNGNDLFTPASTLKLLVTAAALQAMPLDYSPKTNMYLEGAKRNNVFTGILRIEGQGDPNISARYYPSGMFVLNALADSLKVRGIDTIRGVMDFDTSFYKGPRRPTTWRKNFFDSWYGAEISPLSFNDNCVLIEIAPGAKDGDSAKITLKPDVGYVRIKNGVKTGGKGIRWKYTMNPLEPEISFSGTIGSKVSLSSVVLPVRNPTLYFKAAFLEALRQTGIVYVEDVDVYSGKPRDVIEFKGPPLRSMLDEINQRSQNLHAEMLLRNLGKFERGEGSAEAGILSEILFLYNSKIPAISFRLDDGSGLSPSSKLKPNALTSLLSYMKKQKNGNIYYESLAIPKVSGGMKRLASIEFSDKVRFKTGFIEGVHGLAGYMATDGDTLAFALYLNNAQRVNETKARDILDTIVGRIVKFHNKETDNLKLAASLLKSGEAVSGLHNRILFFSDKLKNRPYVLGTMGEGVNVAPDYKIRVNLASFDCVTYIEHVLALSLSNTAYEFWNNLQKIRYKNGTINFEKRNHFLVVDWIANNSSIVSADSSVWGEQSYTFSKTIDKKNFFEKKGIEFAGSNPELQVNYLPKENAIAFADTSKFTSDSIWGVAILSEIEGLDAAHTGFAIAKKGKKLEFRHASQLKGRTTDQSFQEFLKTTKIKTPGVLFFTFQEK